MHDLECLGHGHAGERHLDLGPVYLGDHLTVLASHCGERMSEHPFLEGHDVFHAVDPRHLHVNAGEFGGVTRGKGGLGAEHGADLEDALYACRDGHLLVELRALGQVGGAVEVADLEYFGTGF